MLLVGILTLNLFNRSIHFFHLTHDFIQTFLYGVQRFVNTLVKFKLQRANLLTQRQLLVQLTVAQTVVFILKTLQKIQLAVSYILNLNLLDGKIVPFCIEVVELRRIGHEFLVVGKLVHETFENHRELREALC